jgi:phage terminase Nu1 subunit (DNA packaging protein)
MKHPWDDEAPEAGAEKLRFRDLTKSELAEAIGYTQNEVTAFLRDGMPGVAGKRKTDAWRFDLAPVVQWLANRNSDFDKAKRENLEATAAKRRAEAGRLQGKLIEVDSVEQIAKDAVATFRAKLSYVASHVPAECRDTVQQLHEAAINELAAVDYAKST